MSLPILGVLAASGPRMQSFFAWIAQKFGGLSYTWISQPSLHFEIHEHLDSGF